MSSLGTRKAANVLPDCAKSAHRWGVAESVVSVEIERLDELVAWCRRRGVLSVRLEDGTQIALGPEPLPPAEAKAPLTEEQRLDIERLRRANLERRAFAAGGTFR